MNIVTFIAGAAVGTSLATILMKMFWTKSAAPYDEPLDQSLYWGEQLARERKAHKFLLESYTAGIATILNDRHIQNAVQARSFYIDLDIKDGIARSTDVFQLGVKMVGLAKTNGDTKNV